MKIIAAIYLLVFFLVFAFGFINGMLKGYSDPKKYKQSFFFSLTCVIGFFSVLFIL